MFNFFKTKTEAKGLFFILCQEMFELKYDLYTYTIKDPRIKKNDNNFFILEAAALAFCLIQATVKLSKLPENAKTLVINLLKGYSGARVSLKNGMKLQTWQNFISERENVYGSPSNFFHQDYTLSKYFSLIELEDDSNTNFFQNGYYANAIDATLISCSELITDTQEKNRVVISDTTRDYITKKEWEALKIRIDDTETRLTGIQPNAEKAISEKNEDALSKLKKEFKEFDDQARENSVDTDKLPTGYGPFGLCATNPIPTRNVEGSKAYLLNLRNLKGQGVQSSRIGSTSAPEVTGGMIDMYKVVCKEEAIETTIYICPYHKINSQAAPDGFVLFNQSTQN